MTTLIFDERGFGTGEHLIPWTEVRSVGIRTTAAGPWAEDVFWLFLLREGGGIELPGQVLSGTHLAVLQAQLPGIDNGKIILAMGSTEERMFRVWHQDAERVGWNDARHRTRFTLLVERLGGDGKAAGEAFEKLATAWSEPARRYHNREHLSECLHQLDLVGLGEPATDVAELALWFHDAVYVAGAPDNEESSSQVLLSECGRLQIDRKTAEAAAALVRATAHGASQNELGRDGGLVLDVDLSILGSDPVRFMEYEYSVEEEFEKTPKLKFLIGRGRFLTSLLARPSIFRTTFFRERYEAVARAQLSALLKSPRYRAFRLTSWLRHPLRGVYGRDRRASSGRDLGTRPE
jgi:predicted metal-dependent HD superfamily phosphohydrolase